MIVTLKRLRPFTWPKFAWKSLFARPERIQAQREPGFFENFERLAGHYADTIIRAAE
ncbi:MAG: hypothetical protein ACAH95_18210 [Fimbriimonas sp.]